MVTLCVFHQIMVHYLNYTIYNVDLHYTYIITPLSPETPHRLARNKLNSHSQSPLSLLPPCIPLDSSGFVDCHLHVSSHISFVPSCALHPSIFFAWLHPHIIEPHLPVDDRIPLKYLFCIWQNLVYLYV